MTAELKTIRVFVSSTFRDMHAERDYLNRFVFPELRSRCQRRGADFIGLDLRWGVTEEEAQREGALKICLDEIERCRPFFVCLLGSRYGWVPPPEEVPQELFMDAIRGSPPIALTDWYTLDETNVPPVYRLRRDRPIPHDVSETLARFWEDGRLPNAGESITAREILRGVFDEDFPATHALFYLRKQGLHTDPAFPGAFIPVFVEGDAKRCAKRELLETRIRECADRMVVRDYDVGFAGLRIDPSLLPDTLSEEEHKGLEGGVVTVEEWNRFGASLREAIIERGTVALSGLESLGAMIREDLWSAIEKELERPVEVLDDHERERAYHERFVAYRTRLFLGRDEIVKRILDGLADPAGGNLIVVTGPPGSGKSALLAECARRARELFQSALVLPHFIGVSPGSAFLTNTLRSICETLKRERDVSEEVPEDPLMLSQKWPEFLEEAGSQGRVILLLDALDQLDQLDQSHELGWMPGRMPPGVTLVVSTLPGDCLERLRRRVRAEEIIDVPVLAERDRQSLVEAYLGLRRKKLSRDQLDRLFDTAKRPDAGLPLYLLVALEELSLFGSYEALTDRIDLLPPTVAELFDQVLSRVEQDHGREMTTSICRWIAVSRSGMLESEILDLLTGRDRAFPRARWFRFYRAIEPYMRPVEERTGEGLLAFYHEQLRLAAYRRYLNMRSPEEQPTTDEYRGANGELARHFRSMAIEEDGEFPKWRSDVRRPFDVLPFHEMRGEMWEELERTLTDLGFIEANCTLGLSHRLLSDYHSVMSLPTGNLPRQHLGQYEAFLRKSIHVLHQDPGRTFQEAANQSYASEVMKGAMDRWRAGAEPRPWLSWAHSTGTGVRPTVTLPVGSHDEWRISPDESTVVCWAREKIASLWSLSDCRLIRQWPRAIVGNPTFVKLGAERWTVPVLVDGTVFLVDVRTGQEVDQLLSGLTNVSAFSVSEDPRRLAVGSDDGSLQIVSIGTSRGQRFLRRHEGKVVSCSFLIEGTRLISRDEKAIRLHDVDRDHTILHQPHDYPEYRYSEVSGDGRRLVVEYLDRKESVGCTRVWDIDTGKKLFSVLGKEHVITPLAVSHEGDFLASVENGPRPVVEVWRTADNTRVATLDVDFNLENNICRLAFSMDGKSMIVGRRAPNGRGDIRVYDIRSGNLLLGIRAHSSFVIRCCFLQRRERFATSGAEGTIKIWDMREFGATEDEVRRTMPRCVVSCDVSPDGATVIAVTERLSLLVSNSDAPVPRSGVRASLLQKGRLWRWRLESPAGGAPRLRLTGAKDCGEQNPKDCCFRSDGRHILEVSHATKTIEEAGTRVHRVWSTRRLKRARRLRAMKKELSAPRSRRMIAASCLPVVHPRQTIRRKMH